LGDVYRIFSRPEHDFTRGLVGRTSDLSLPDRLLGREDGRTVKIIYHNDRAEEPLLSEAILAYGVRANILQSNIEYIGGRSTGTLVVRFTGEASKLDAAVSLTVRRRPSSCASSCPKPCRASCAESPSPSSGW
jgi:D-methionine transport system ATP-binding protein